MGYQSTPARVARVKDLEAQYLAAIKDCTKRSEADVFGVETWHLCYYYDELVTAGLTTAENAVYKKLSSLKD